MPFGQYKNFKDCVSKNRDKRDPEAYCATIERNIKKAHKRKKTHTGRAKKKVKR